jgi:hypothetical protein
VSIDSVDVQTLTTALLSVLKRARVQAGLTRSGLFRLALMLLTSYCTQDGNPEFVNVINSAQTVIHVLV